tara:strand:- start:1029 stop:1217 length:189 start_codon:yes stop_codon:yes gene_type:complete
MDFKSLVLIALLSIFLDQLGLYFDCSLCSILFFINLVGLYLMIVQIDIDINIRYGQVENDSD